MAFSVSKAINFDGLPSPSGDNRQPALPVASLTPLLLLSFNIQSYPPLLAIWNF